MLDKDHVSHVMLILRGYLNINFNFKLSFQCSTVLSALSAANTGTHALENAANTVSGILGDLDTTIMFATAGTLNADVDDESFAGKFYS